MIVVDATVWVDLLRGALPPGYAERIRIAGCVAPLHVDFEVGSALIRLARRGELEFDQARALIAAFSTHPVERVRDPAVSVGAVALIDNSTYADAWYIALAQRLSYPLMTLDDGMQKAARMPDVEVVGPTG
ncbi:type II toxin-antitoxin system VapC family toxin [Nocardia carnea]|uniref:type II toxin-antitoxin system VapC family toxin n=1 Tax=Nocardia carnea TaxID=37328 RepID=UPI0024549B26|nr:type II toxin-antitoxin system VapC family toxin [Nocardia carnea]